MSSTSPTVWAVWRRTCREESKQPFNVAIMDSFIMSSFAVLYIKNVCWRHIVTYEREELVLFTIFLQSYIIIVVR